LLPRPTYRNASSQEDTQAVGSRQPEPAHRPHEHHFQWRASP